MVQQQKELMTVDVFLEIYNLSKCRFYSEAKKYPWLITKLGHRSHIRRIDADLWLEAIKAESNASLTPQQHP